MPRVSRTPHGVRGLKFKRLHVRAHGVGRTPHGVRGLKYRHDEGAGAQNRSHPSLGAWIEMDQRRGVAICFASHPSRGAWIEIPRHSLQPVRITVAPLTGCVD